MAARKNAPTRLLPHAARRAQVLEVLKAHPECLASRDVAREIQLSQPRTTEILRALRKEGLALPTADNMHAKWGTPKYAIPIREALIAQAAEAARYSAELRAKEARRKADQEAAERWCEAWANAPAYRVTSAANAPRIERSKPYSVFTLAAA